MKTIKAYCDKRLRAGDKARHVDGYVYRMTELQGLEPNVEIKTLEITPSPNFNIAICKELK